MLKKKNLFLALFLVFVSSLFIMKGNVWAATTDAPDSFTLSRADAVNLTGSNYISGINLNYQKKITNTKKYVYCIERLDTFTTTKETYTKVGLADAGLAYILEHGYPNVSLTGNGDEDYWVTGVAVWYYLEPNSTLWRYFDFENGTYRGTYNKNVVTINNLVKAAKNASYSTPTLSINNNGGKLKLNNAGTYYVSSKLTVNSKNIKNYTVSIGNNSYGAYVADQNGASKTTFSAEEGFYIYVPASKVNGFDNIHINVSATGSVNKAYRYDPAVSSHQSVVALYPEYTNLNTTTVLSIDYVEPKTTKVNIYKIDSSSRDNIVGATLQLQDKSGNIIDTWTTNGKAHKIEGLSFGTYYIVEIAAPYGYELNSEPVKFTLTEDNYEQSINFYNTRKITTSVSILKLDSETGLPLENATLVVKDAEGNVITEWTTSKEAHSIIGLEPSKTYYLSEKSAPEGYDLNSSIIEFTVNSDGTTKTINFYNNKTPLPENPQTGVVEYLIPSALTITGSGLGLKVLKRKKSFKQF